MPKTKRKNTSRTDRYRVIGVMSGSSLDGLDLALCTLEKGRTGWTYAMEKARTVPYAPMVREMLSQLMHGNAQQLAGMHVHLGEFIGKECKKLMSGKVDLIASHGHTIFHQPRASFTTQIGSGASIAAITGITTVCDFRSTDMALGGQGAPLVPLGEKLLFQHYRAFLNIGGICNIALHAPTRVTGYDVCIGNQALDHLAQQSGAAYDKGGKLASTGKVDPELLKRLNALPFHKQAPPRSLGREWFASDVRPLIDNDQIPLADRLCTVVEHIAQQLGPALRNARTPVLVTGGGAHNTYLIARLRAHARAEILVPDRTVVNYKEALVFALLGVLRMRSEVNALASVTGARRDSVGGAVYLPN